MQPENEQLKIETREGSPESFAQKLGSLFKRVISRTLEIREDLGQRIVDADPKKWNKIKKIPFVRSVAMAGEIVLGAEPGKRLSSREVLVKSAVATFMGIEDTLLVEEEKTRGKDNVFQGKTMRIVSDLKEKAVKNDSKRAPVISAVFDFLFENQDIVRDAENKLHSILQAEAA